eukprot:EG_transcript_27835
MNATYTTLPIVFDGEAAEFPAHSTVAKEAPVTRLLRRLAAVSLIAAVTLWGVTWLQRDTAAMAVETFTRQPSSAVRPTSGLFAEQSKDKTLNVLEVLEAAEKKAAAAELKAKSSNGEYDIEELEALAPKPVEVSAEMKRKLRQEYLALGGGTNARMNNYFLWICVVVSALAVATWLSGGCDVGY